MNEKRNLVLLIIYSLFLAALLSRNAGLAWMTLPFLFYLGAGLLASPKEVRLRASRAVDPLRCDAGTSVTMTMTIENDGPAVPRLRICEPDRPDVRVIDGLAEQVTALAAGECAVLRYAFQAQRGHYRWENARVVVGDPFGLFETELDLQAAAEVRVLPELVSLRRLRLRPHETLHAPGPNLSRLPGAGIDFYGVREYHAGDSLRWVHWRLSARHPRKFFSKQFEREEMADIGLIVDGSAAANRINGPEELFEHLLKAAAALSRNLLQAGNRVSLLVLGERVVRVFPGTGKNQLARILDTLAGCRPGERISLNTLKYLPVRLFPSHSLIVLISPLRRSDFPAVARLRAGGYQVLLVSPDPVGVAGASSHHPLAVRAAQLERKALLWRMREIGAQVIDWPVDQPLSRMTDAFHWARR